MELLKNEKGKNLSISNEFLKKMITAKNGQFLMSC
jgi:hypothetical protein